MSVRLGKSGLVFDHAINPITGEMACDRSSAKRDRPTNKRRVRIAVDVAAPGPREQLAKLIPHLNRL